jgi:precorrin-2 dehydrogenase / sirohydrochlorin ferrochelatase
MSQVTLYPIFLNLDNAPVLIVGGGSVALRKTLGLLTAGARITVVSPAFAPELEQLHIIRVAQHYDPAHITLSRWKLVFAATGDSEVNAAVARDAAVYRILCCRADSGAESDFVGGAMGFAGGVTVAISTDKASPVLAARLRDAAVAGLDPVLVEWTGLLAVWRAKVIACIRDAASRRALLKRISGPEMEGVYRQRGRAGAEESFSQWLNEAGGTDGR